MEPTLEELVPLVAFLARIPALEAGVGSGRAEDGTWWVKFGIDIAHPLAWQTVQEMAHVLNYLSINTRLPTVFKPVSPPPYLNGGPEFLSWVVECHDPAFTPAECARWLESRLPNPVDDPSKWLEAADEAE